MITGMTALSTPAVHPAAVAARQQRLGRGWAGTEHT